MPALSCGPKLTAKSSASSTPSTWLKPNLKPPSSSTNPNPQPPKQSPLQTQNTCFTPMHSMPPHGKIVGPRSLARPCMPSRLDQAGPRQMPILGQRFKPTSVSPSPHFNLPRGPSVPRRPMSSSHPTSLVKLNLPANQYSGKRLELNSSPILKRKEAPYQEFQPQKGGKMSKLFCGVCEVTCTSALNLKMHLRGQKHKAKVSRLRTTEKGIQVNSFEANDPIIKCNLCGIWCMNQVSYQEHLNGKNHILKLHAAQKKRKEFG